MDVKQKAKEFAIKAHAGQVRKAEPDVPYVFHSIGVAELLEQLNYDDHVIAAAYLHDVLEDTNYTLEDLKQEFNLDIANLVESVSETNKELSWEQRKEMMIDNIRERPLRSKVISCSDKINNIEDLIRLVKQNGLKIFKSFHRNYDKQLWYYKSIYESLIDHQDENLPIFKRLKNDIEFLEEEIRKHILDENISLY